MHGDNGFESPKRGASNSQQHTKGSIGPEDNTASQSELFGKMLDEQKKKLKQLKPMWKVKMSKVMNHWIITLIMTLITLYALFGDDIKIVCFTRSEDTTFNYLTTAVLVLFTLELVLNALSQDNYFNSFYFWLDVISTLSLITDISWVWDAIFGEQEDYSANNADQAGQLARAGRGARIGTRAGRITRVIRIVRLIRIGRLWKQANSTLNRRSQFSKKDEFAVLMRQKSQIENLKEQKTMEASKRDMDKINRKVS